MNFSSFGYILVFLPAVLVLCELARKLPIAKAPQLCILTASLVFYSQARAFNLIYLVGSILANWLIARWVCSSTGPSRKLLLQAGLVLNVAFLCTFKYLNFFVGNLPLVIARRIHVPELAFPLGISFFTLTQVMYLVDCYEELIPASNLFDHATFVSFFPCVISGPLNRAKRILHQFPALNARESVPADVMARAIFLFSMGLIKKVVLADSFSKVADFGFSNISSLSALDAWCCICAYAFQIYFDFSGYSDMAIASGLMLGIEVPRNFESPLRSLSIIEYWQRWHITLTAFITTYLYTPILRAFQRATLFTSAVATFFAMTIAGLWHGANWTFVIFGSVHGAGLVINQYWRKKKMPKLPHWLSWVITFAVIDVAFVFFRAPNLGSALLYMQHLAYWRGSLSMGFLREMNGAGVMTNVFLLVELIGIGIVFFGKSSNQLAHEFRPTWLNSAMAVACTLIAFLYLNSNVAKPFIYFAF